VIPCVDAERGELCGVHPMSNRGAYDPATLEFLRTVLDEAWDALAPRHKEQISKSYLAECVLRNAANGERHANRLRYRVIADVTRKIGTAK
jgi:hypothetical protein